MSTTRFNLIFLGIEVSVTMQMGNDDIPAARQLFAGWRKVMFAIVNATVVLIFMVEDEEEKSEKPRKADAKRPSAKPPRRGKKSPVEQVMFAIVNATVVLIFMVEAF
ncbi:hypothetical protein AK812_SmicGene45713 [Symbiodinium microadriaticum]|uniref:Uncharacterized protein n=1 Tax=Symbiodinium microadriaticum TaxID=2951 RepID=A0A1Q9BVI1_SYMMI|nr:hypothetical protein AK812_SmicGene45713 [Symbiodinium microadriaticum]